MNVAVLGLELVDAFLDVGVRLADGLRRCRELLVSGTAGGGIGVWLVVDRGVLLLAADGAVGEVGDTGHGDAADGAPQACLGHATGGALVVLVVADVGDALLRGLLDAFLQRVAGIALQGREAGGAEVVDRLLGDVRRGLLALIAGPLREAVLDPSRTGSEHVLGSAEGEAGHIDRHVRSGGRLLVGVQLVVGHLALVVGLGDRPAGRRLPEVGGCGADGEHRRQQGADRGLEQVVREVAADIGLAEIADLAERGEHLVGGVHLLLGLLVPVLASLGLLVLGLLAGTRHLVDGLLLLALGLALGLRVVLPCVRVARAVYSVVHSADEVAERGEARSPVGDVRRAGVDAAVAMGLVLDDSHEDTAVL